jgi:hypothetical protein
MNAAWDFRLAEIAQLDTTLLLPQAAAAFYVLYDYSIDHPETRALLERYAHYLAGQFSRYMLHAIVGEVRHYGWKDWGAIDALEVLARRFKSEEAHQVFFTLADTLAPLAGTCDSRTISWQYTDFLVDALGKETLIEACAILFDLATWCGSDIGGQAWALIARTLLDYTQAGINDVVFVDTAFGLKHNGNLQFDKVWYTDEVEEVLNANKEGKIHLLKKWLPKEVTEFVEERLDRQHKKPSVKD